MQINLPQTINRNDFTPVPNEYSRIMQRVANIFATRSGLKIDWNDPEHGYPATVISTNITLNGVLRTNLAWNTMEFFPKGFMNSVDQSTLTSEQANFIISKLLEICDIEGITYDHSVGLDNEYHYTPVKSTLSITENAGVVTQFFESSVINDILSRLENESYTAPVSYCRGACTGLCVEFCGTSCAGICGNSCETSCIGYCNTSCANRCTSDCANKCSEQCSGYCTNHCSGKCSNMCDTNCTDSCSVTCMGTCINTCAMSCAQSCDDTCETTCNDGCVTACLGTCNDTCKNGCADACGSTCGNSCTNTNIA